MSKDSSFSSRDSGNGRKNTFKKSDSKPFAKEGRPYKKKNYDGRPAAGGSDEGRARTAKPYSGRLADSDRPKRSFDGGSRPGTHDEEGRKPRRAFDNSGRSGNDRPFSDRPKRSFDKPDFKKDDKRGDGTPQRDKPFSDRPKRTFDKPGFKKEDKRDDDSPRNKKPFSDRPKRTFDKPGFKKDDTREGKERKPFNKEDRGGDDKPQRKFDKPDRPAGDSRPFRDRPKRTTDKPGFRKERPEKNDFITDGTENEKPKFGDVLDRAFNPPKAPKTEDHPGKRQVFEDQVFGALEDVVPGSGLKKPFEKKADRPGKKKFIHDHSEGRKKKYKEDEDDEEEDKEIHQTNGPRLEMPLNKYIAHSGECSRRDAADLVRQGKVKVNGELVLEPGYKVKHDDKVTMSGKKLTPQKGMVYILLNKPKGFITTNDDPQGRKTVMDLVGNSGVERLFPVGRLDKETSGLLLITNDGDLTQKLCHPAYDVKKVYQVTLDKPLTKADFDKIMDGLDLEDGIAKVDALAYLEKKNELGIEIHSGRNRIVRRIFESLGYEVTKLDRMMYAGLTKKNLPRSKWRYLDEREVVLLKHFKS
jgi:23S rRNA pseudouridine2605 synthase